MLHILVVINTGASRGIEWDYPPSWIHRTPTGLSGLFQLPIRQDCEADAYHSSILWEFEMRDPLNFYPLTNVADYITEFTVHNVDPNYMYDIITAIIYRIYYLEDSC